MILTDILDVEKLEAQCDSMIKKLKKGNKRLDKSKTRLQQVIDCPELGGEAYDQLRTQIENYFLIINSIKIVNEYTIEDCEDLKIEMGTETLDGSVIVANRDKCEKWLMESQCELDKCQKALLYETDKWKKRKLKDKIKHQEGNIVYYTDLVNQWQEKCNQYDKIESTTARLFNGLDAYRASINSVLDQISGFYKNGQYTDAVYETSWKDALLIFAGICSTERTCQLKQENFICITDDKGNVYYGGNQYWFLEEGMLDGEFFDRNGCGFIALVDASLYVNGRFNISKEEYLKYAYEMYNSNPFFKKHMVDRDLGLYAHGIFDKNDMESLYGEIMKKKGYSGAGWHLGSKISLTDIKSQLERDIPVLIGIGSVEEGPQLRFYWKDSEGDLIFEQEKAAHIATITGVEVYKNPINCSTKTLLQIATWGRQFYVDFDELTSLKDQCTEEKMLSYIGGGYNTSYVY